MKLALLIIGVSAYFIVLIIYVLKKSKKYQAELIDAWREYDKALIELSKNPHDKDLAAKAYDLGSQYYQYRYPDTTSFSVLSSMIPVAEHSYYTSYNSGNSQRNAILRENALKNDIESRINGSIKKAA